MHGPEILFHQSPDNHGFAATVGTFVNDISFDNLAQRYLAATGLDKAHFYGQRSPRLDSVWNIPDMQLRFSSDMVFSVGRIGFPTLIAFLSQLGNYELIFSSSLLFFGAIGVVFLQIIYAEAFLTYTRKARPSKGNFDNKIYLI